MKKSVMVLAVLSAFSAAAIAESNVTLYGQIDEGVLVNKQKEQPASVQLAPNIDKASFWGIKGVEDLGGGNAVGFILESGLKGDNGGFGATSYGSTSGFTREAQMYLKGNWGQFGFGRLGPLTCAQTTAIIAGWAFYTGTHMSSWTGLGNLNHGFYDRINNGLYYQSPEAGGFKLHLMYSNGVGDDTAKWSENTHYYGAGLVYHAYNIHSILVYEGQDWKGEKWLNDGNSSDNGRGMQHLVTFGFEYNLGSWTPMFIYQYNSIDNDYKTHLFGLSAKADMLGGEVRAGIRYIFGKNEGWSGDKLARYGGDDKVNWLNVGLGYTYPLSKRTSIVTLASYAYGGKAWGNKGFLKDNSNVIYNGYQLYLGMRHRF